MQEALQAVLAAVCNFLSHLRVQSVQAEQSQSTLAQPTDKRGSTQKSSAAKHTVQEPGTVVAADSGKRKRAKLSA